MRRSTRQTRELARRLGKLTEAQAAVGWAVILVLAALLGAIYLNQTSEIAAAGRRVQILQNELDDLKRLNAETERQIAESESLDRLQQQAVAMGFVPATTEDIEFLVVPNFPAAGAGIADPATPTPQAPRAMAETMQEALRLALQNAITRLFVGEYREQ